MSDLWFDRAARPLRLPRFAQRLASHWQLLPAVLSLAVFLSVHAQLLDDRAAARVVPAPVQAVQPVAMMTDGSTCWISAPTGVDAGANSDYCADETAMSIVSATAPKGGRGLFRLHLLGGNGADTETVSIPTGPALLNTFHPGGMVVLLWEGSSIVAVGTDTDLVQTTLSPVYTADANAQTDLAGVIAFLALTVLFGGWWAAGTVQRLRHAERRFRWWVPCSLPAVAATFVILGQVADHPRPVGWGSYVVPWCLLAAGLLLSLGLSAITPGRGGPAVADTAFPPEWSPPTPQW